MPTDWPDGCKEYNIERRVAEASKALSECKLLDTVLLFATTQSRLEDNIGDAIISYLIGGSWMTKVTRKLKTFRRYYYFSKTKKSVCYCGSRWRKAENAKYNIRDIVDIRLGFLSDTFNKMTDKLKESCCISIIFGNAPRKPLNLVTEAPEICAVWAKGLSYLRYCNDQLKRQQDEQMLIKDLFYSADITNDNQLQFEEVWLLLQRMSVKMSHKEALEKFRAADMDHVVDAKQKMSLSLSEFVHLYHELCKRREVHDLFHEVSGTGLECITTSNLQAFMRHAQKVSDFTLEDAKKLIDVCEPHHSNRQRHALSIDGFYFLLNSSQMNAFNIGHSEVYQDMTQPLSHYFICSSHNTYLMADQLKGNSSIEGYIRALMIGCRCVELDCWDGPDSKPIVYHGHTLTSKLLFQDIIEDAICDYAFYCTEFPLILSIENHCSVEQQEVMATILKTALGDKLYSAPVQRDLWRLPSPADLKGKILIKCRKNKVADTTDGELSPLGDEDDDSEKSEDRDVVDATAPKKDKKQPKSSLAKDFSDLVNYMQSVTFKSFDQVKQKGKCYEMSSFSESHALKLATESAVDFVQLTEMQLCRTYPSGTRTSSSNYCPVDKWNIGAQMVALNFQTSDLWMQIYRGKFRDNGKCGYILKPPFMRINNAQFNPQDASVRVNRQYIRIKVISGCHLPKPEGREEGKDIVDPFVSIFVYGVNSDWIKLKTETVKDNGLNPQWNEDFEFYVNVPELAIVHFVVKDYNALGSNLLIGQFSLPLTSLVEGYRQVKLETAEGQPLGPAAIFVHVSIQAEPYKKDPAIGKVSLSKKVKKNALPHQSFEQVQGADKGAAMVAELDTNHVRDGNKAQRGYTDRGQAVSCRMTSV